MTSAMTMRATRQFPNLRRSWSLSEKCSSSVRAGRCGTSFIDPFFLADVSQVVSEYWRDAVVGSTATRILITQNSGHEYEINRNSTKELRVSMARETTTDKGMSLSKEIGLSSVKPAAKILIEPFLSDDPFWDKGWSSYLAGKNSTQRGDR